MMKKNSPVNKKMKERMKYVEEFLAESLKKNENLNLVQIGLYGLSKRM